MEGVKVLLVDDDPKVRGFLGRGLRESGAECEIAASGEEADQRLQDAGFDLVLLDVMLGGVDGWTLLEQLRERGDDTPVIFLTARHRVDERIRGLSMGADDYVVKPFDFAELVARIKAVLRRRSSVPLLRFHTLRLDPAGRTAVSAGEDLELSQREFDLLHALAKRQGAVATRADLLLEVWKMDFDPGTNVVDVAITRLRRRVHRRGIVRIQAVVGQGYRLSVED